MSLWKQWGPIRREYYSGERRMYRHILYVNHIIQSVICPLRILNSVYQLGSGGLNPEILFGYTPDVYQRPLGLILNGIAWWMQRKVLVRNKCFPITINERNPRGYTISEILGHGDSTHTEDEVNATNIVVLRYFVW